MKTRLVIALDEPELSQALEIVSATRAYVDCYKVGYEAYYGYGERIIAAIREAGKSLFLDLKLHDIPNTVAAGVRAAAKTGAALLTVHAGGGSAMLRAAASARDEAARGRLRLLAVTVLTSLDADALRETGIASAPEDLVQARVRLAQRCGIDGVVCAVSDARSVRSWTGEDFTIACPGIRPAGASAGDQRRVATPADAIRAGADFIVVGRPITQSSDPAAATQAILNEMQGAIA